MHDSLARTLHGIALQASALVKWMTRDPQRAATEARSLAGAAEVAATQGRELIQDLRNDLLDLPLSVAVRDYVDGWSETSGIASVTDVSDTSDVSPGARWELFSVLKEALRNVERHARADKVRVGLRRREEWIEMDVQDDGAGFGVPTDLRTLVSNGHFGLVGMTERAEAVGGSLQIDSIPGSGTTVIARVPAQPDEDRRAEPAGGVR
jgi:signal transduction histidine kinase